MDVQEIASIVEVVVVVGATIAAYLRWRKRNFGLVDFFLFVPLALCVDGLVYWLFHVVRQTSDYAGLVALLLLLGLLPVAVGLTVMATMATAVAWGHHPAIRGAMMGLVTLLGIAYFIHGHWDAENKPGGQLNNDRVAGENWALESGATSKADCDRQSSAAGFRAGCYAQLRR